MSGFLITAASRFPVLKASDRNTTMFEKYIICTRGFRNVIQDGQTTGFQLNVRISYYRGIPLSCVEGFDVTVDGEAFSPDKMRYAIGDRTFTVGEAAQAE